MARFSENGRDKDMPPSSAVLCQTWVYAQEESSRELMVFYSESYPLPPSRGRARMRFDRAGTFTRWIIAPACGFDEILGTWEWRQGVIYISEAQGERELVVDALTDQRLCLQAAPGLLYR
ncbi:hypothetical protein [Halomicronema sp. CCY15110]|uniref:hypothetical protein n=1 Tax=Halomicronema sp. CCY15110 TaxID=2767773 RepID=UPI0019512B39|nr:hypothetical protein [Halomicronema sp. CCY15110]